MKKLFIYPIILSLCLLQGTSSQAENQRFSMSYLYFGSPTSYVKQVEKTRGSLDVVSPSYFDIEEDGSLSITWKLKEDFITKMHEQNIKVVPFLSNHWSKSAGENALLTEDSRLALVMDIKNAIEEYNLDGVNVDIEGVRHPSSTNPDINFRDAFSDLIKKLRLAIPEDKEVSVAVAANPNGWSTGWHGFYDYKALGEYADYLMIMAYDESWDGTPYGPGPVASQSFVERSIHYALQKDVPRDKIVLGLPFYGRIWKLDGLTEDGIFLNGRGISAYRVEPLVQQFNGTITYSEEKQSPMAAFTVPEGEESFIGSLKLSPGDYAIWFENAKSLKKKLRLINEYDLKGAGSWSLYQEANYTWDFYRLFLNGRIFADVPSGHWAESNVLTVNDLGWMNGINLTDFAPNEPLTRAQGAVILVRALGLTNTNKDNGDFTDTKGHWAQKSIAIAKAHGLVEGIGNQKYAPDAPLTREQLATLLQNIFQYNIEEMNEPAFPDVDINRWSAKPIKAMKENGIIGGFDNGLFKPTDVSTRAQMATLMTRLLEDFELKKMELDNRDNM